MKKNKKILISLISLVFVVAVAVTSITFTLAGNKNNSAPTPGVTTNSVDVGSKTVIDYIIQNSNNDSGKPYRVIEIGPKAESSATAFENFVLGGSLKNNVFNANSTTDALFSDANGKIEYKYYSTTTINTASKVVPDGKTTSPYEDILAYIAGADFVYISNASTTYDPSNGTDICEDLYDILHTYSVGSYKPLVIENPNSSVTPDVPGVSDTTTFGNLACDQLRANGTSYKAYEWPTGMPVVDYLKGALGSGSRYSGINGTTRQSSWTKFNDGTEDKYVAKFLVVSASGSSWGAGNDFEIAENLSNYHSTPVNLDTYGITGGNIIVVDKDYDDNLVYKNRYERPDYVQFEEISLSNFNTSLNTDKYDMIIFEDDLKTIQLGPTDTWYTKTIEVMKGNKQIVFTEGVVGASSGSGSGGSGESGTVSNDSNYKELYYMVATNDAVSRYVNVMVTSKSDFNIIIKSNSDDTCRPIATLINSSSFRGIGGPGAGSTSTFTVLEIQPCYPIDTKVAAALGGKYYTIPSEVKDGKTPEQLGYEEDTATGQYLLNGQPVSATNAVEYYKWELSESMVADALGMDASQVKVVHMSSEELASNKTEPLGTYDMIYIGGDISALWDVNEYVSIAFDWGNSIGQRLGSTDPSKFLGLPIYTMYSHNGDMVRFKGGVFDNSKLSAITSYTGNSDSTFGLLNGNDISYDNYTKLKSYVDAGMPVIVSAKVSAAYDIIHSNVDANGNFTQASFMQNSLDPTSNMYKFLDYCMDAKTNGTKGLGSNTAKNGLTKSVLWNFDITSTELVDNDDGRLGDTATGYVRVLKGNSKTDFKQVYKDANQRAKLALTSMPAVYNLYDASTKLSDKKLDFTFEVTGSSNYTVKLYADYNLDNTFSTELPCTVDLTKGTVSCDLSKVDKFGSSFYGPVFWKFEVTDNESGTKVSTTNIAYIKPPANTKPQEINILQIIPVDVGGSNATGRQGNVNLLFCTECQRALGVLEYNPRSDQNFNYNTYYDFHLFDCDTTNGYFKMNGGTEVYMGLHEHNFGIVKYDSSMMYEGATTPGMDDWDDNLADEVADLYNFDVDILTSREVEEVSAYVRTEAANRLSTYGEFAGKSLASLTDDEKAAFKALLQREADSLYTAYEATFADVDAAKKELDKELKKMIEYCETNGYTKEKGYFERILKESYYEDYYIYYNGRNELYWASTHPQWNFANYTKLYETYAHAMDKKILAKEEYDKANRVANYDNWMYGCYQTVIFGPAEDFNNDDIKDADTLDDIENYIVSGGNTMLFHTIISVYDKDGVSMSKNPGPVELSKRIRSLVGMDKNHLTVDTATLGSTKPYYTLYKPVTETYVDGSTKTYDKNKYYIMNLSNKPNVTYKEETRDGETVLVAEPVLSTYTNWTSDMEAVTRPDAYNSGLKPSKYLTSEAFTNTTWVAVTGYGGSEPTQYKYAKYNHTHATTYARAEAAIATRGTDRASQTNKGIITLYPFTLSDSLNISGTHGQAYALDVENSATTVWYTFGGGSNNLSDFSPEDSSIYAASPRDGVDSYFIYSYGNVFYCGAGHSEITGMKKDNNDERRLYINVICNSVTNKGVNDIVVYDYQKQTNKDVVASTTPDCDYTYKMDASPADSDIYPKFSFVITTKKGNSISGISLYYDYGDNGRSEIVNTAYGINSVTGMYDVPLNLSSIDPSVKLDTSKLINNKYAYLVIEVKTTKGTTITKKIKIILNPYLFDLS